MWNKRCKTFTFYNIDSNSARGWVSRRILESVGHSGLTDWEKVSRLVGTAGKDSLPRVISSSRLSVKYIDTGGTNFNLTGDCSTGHRYDRWSSVN